jgi:hypothetical protein
LINSRPYFTKSTKSWYELWNQRKVENFHNEKIVVAELSDRNRFMIDENNLYYGDTVCGFYLKPDFKLSSKYILGLLNSKLIELYYKKTTVPKANDFFIYKTMFLKEIPIYNLNIDDSDKKTKHDKMVYLVNQMLSSQKELQKTNTDQDNAVLTRQIDMLDTQINRLVYDLYGLTEDEIKVVEGMNTGE